jgi:hypothetical protein
MKHREPFSDSLFNRNPSHQCFITGIKYYYMVELYDKGHETDFKDELAVLRGWFLLMVSHVRVNVLV